MSSEDLIMKAVIAIIAFMLLNSYVNGFLTKSNFSVEIAAIGSLISSIIIVGIIFGAVAIFLQGVIKR